MNKDLKKQVVAMFIRVGYCEAYSLAEKQLRNLTEEEVIFQVDEAIATA